MHKLAHKLAQIEAPTHTGKHAQIAPYVVGAMCACSACAQTGVTTRGRHPS